MRSHHTLALSHRIQKLLALVPSTFKWRLTHRAPLSTWVHKDGKLALLGDACHPMVVRTHGFPSRQVHLILLRSLTEHRDVLWP